MHELSLTLAVVPALLLLVLHGASGGAEPVRVFLVPTTHMDIDYTAPPETTMRQYVGFVRRALEACDRDPRQRFSVQLTSVAAAFWEQASLDERETFARLAREGRVELAANWTNPHYSELPEELFVRQVAGSAMWSYEHLGVWPTVADNGELADVTPQLAAVLTGAGVGRFHSYKTVRLPPPARGPGYTGTMWFVGLDGSRVLYNADNYNQSVEFAEQFRDRPWDWPAGRPSGERGLERCPTGSARLFTDGGPGWDDCLPEFTRLAAFVEGWSADPQCAAMGTYQLATYGEFFEDVERQVGAGLALPVRTGHTEHGELLYRWAWNRYRDLTLFHEAMVQAEALGAWCDWLGLGGLDPAETDAAWRLAMDGCTHNWGNRDRETGQLVAKVAEARAAAERMRDRMLARLGHREAAGTGVGAAQLVANTLPHARRELIAVGDGYRAVDLPAMGYVIVPEDTAGPPAADLVAGEGVIENAFYRVRATDADGLVEVYDKRRGRALLRPVEGATVLSLRSTYQEALAAADPYVRPTGSADQAAARLMVGFMRRLDGTFSPASVRTRLAGDAAELAIAGQLAGAPAEIVVRLASDLDWVEVSFSGGAMAPPDAMLSDERLRDVLGRGPMAFATLEFDVPNDADARTSVPFGSVRMPRSLPALGPADAERFSRATEQAGAEGWNGVYDESWHTPLGELYAARAVQPRWTCLWTAQGGVTWLQRAPFANLLRDREHPTRFHKSLWQGASEGGQYVWRLYGHEGDWRSAQAPRRAAELNAPVLALGGLALDEGTRSFLAIETPNLVCDALRRSFDGRGHILRLHEAHDTQAVVEWNTAAPVGRATQVDLVERPIRGEQDGPVTVRPFGIVTLRLEGPAQP